jgi:hypothetical protein
MKSVLNSFIDLTLLWFVDMPSTQKPEQVSLKDCKGCTGSSRHCCSLHSVITDSIAAKEFSNIK